MREYLNNLTSEELTELYNHNKWFQEHIYNYAIECENDYLSEILEPLRECKGLDYQLGSGYHDYINIRFDYIDEIMDGFYKMQRNYCVFPDSDTDIIKRLRDKAAFMSECVNGYEDISENRWCNLFKWYENHIERLKHELIDFCQQLMDINEEEWIESYVDCIGDNYMTDNNIIYETTVRSYM